MQLEITSYGNGPLITGVLQGIANITTSSDYQVLLMTILGLAIVLGVYGYHKDLISFGSGAHHSWMTKAAGAFTIYWLLSAGSINVFIYDPLNTYTGVADNVPIGIAMPYYLQNQISENLSTLYGEWLAPSGYASEFSYDNPNNGAGFYNPGIVSPLHAINVMMNAHFTDMYFYETLSDFEENCLVPAMILGVVNPNELYIAGPGQSAPDDSVIDLLNTDMPNMSGAWTSTVYTSSDPGGITESCNASWPTIATDVINMTDTAGAITNQFTANFNAATNSTQTAAADQAILGDAASYMFNISTNGQQVLAQAALMNTIGDGISQFSQATGTSNSAQSYALTQAMSQSQSSWTTSAIMAAKMLPIFHLIMEVIVIALFPLFFALAVIPTMTGKYLKLLFELLMWLAMWSPIASIINYIAQFFMQSRVFINISNPLSGTAGFNLANYNFIMQNSYIYTAVIGAMMWMIPVLSFGLVTGSAYVISGAISAAQGTAHGAAQQQGASVGTSSGLQGIGSQAGNLAGMQSEEKQGYNPAQAAEKIAGMGALDNLTNASAFGNNLQMNGLNNMIKAKTSNQEQSIASGIATAAQAQQLGNFKGEQSLAGMNGANYAAKKLGFSNTNDYLNAIAKASGINQGAQGLAESQHPNEFANSAVMASSNKLAQAMQYQSFMQETGMLPKNFNSMSADQKLDSLVQADKNLTGNFSGVNLNAAQAHELGLPEAGTYDFHMNNQGQMVAISGKGSQSFTGILDTSQGRFVGTETGEIGGSPIYINGNVGHKFNDENVNNRTNEHLTTNAFGTKNTLYNDQYNVGMTPGVLEGAMAYKGKGAGQFLSPGQKSMTNFVLSGKAGQGYKENFISQGIDAFAKVKDTSQVNAQNITGQLEAFAGLENKIYAGAGISFGVKAGDELVVKAGAKGSFTIGYNELNQMKINEFKESAFNSKDVQGAKTFTQFKSALNKSFSETTPIENQLVKAVGTKFKSMGINPIASLTNGTSKQAEIHNLAVELNKGEITQAQYIKDATKIGEGTHKL